MRSAIALACASLALAAAAACAASDEAAEPPANDGGPSPLSDAAPDSVGPDGPPIVSSCSDAGWCLTPLPDPDLTLIDIRPFEGRAFAIAESVTLGVKILEWDEATRAWSYIDDNSQNSFAHATWAGKLWAPSENEIYFGAGAGFIYHGKRATPSEAWTWQSSKLDDHSRDTQSGRDHGRVQYWNLYGLSVEHPAIGVWGAGPDDVYAWYANAIFHLKSADGGPAWVAEYIADDRDNPGDTFFVFSASGSGPDDIWFGGGRARFDGGGVFRCPIAVHKTAAGYQRLVDNVITESGSYYYGTCLPKKGALNFRWSTGREMRDWTDGHWLTNVESVGAGRVVGILENDLFAYATSEGAGLASVNRVYARVPRDLVPSLLNSVWVQGSEAWFSGWGLVLRTANDPAKWKTGLGLFTPDDAQDRGLDAATFALSPTAINGAPIDKPLYQVRGTSNTNLWAIGFHHALHKTTP